MVGGISRREFFKRTILYATLAGTEQLVSFLSGCRNISNIGDINLFGRGFKTGTISIPELKIDVALPPDNYYRIEYVKDTANRSKEIANKYGIDCNYKSESYLNGEYIRIQKNNSNKETTHFILIDKDANIETRINGICHEHGHLIWSLDQQDLIYTKFTSPDYVKSYISDGEDFALLCGWLGLKMAGYDTERYRCVSDDKRLLEKDKVMKELIIKHYK